jgi:hypothetical protein
MQAIETVTVGSGGAASITFSSIAANYTDLKLLVSGRCSTTDTTATIAYNTGGTYTRRTLLGSGSAATSNTSAVDFRISQSGDTASTFGNSEIYIPNYAGSTTKSYSVDSINENNATAAFQAITAGLWNQTAAITSIVLTPGSGNFVEHSTATLYGILAGSDGTTTVT